MLNNAKMLAKDAVSAKLAECYVTIDKERYNLMQMINLEAKFEKNKSEVPILGKTGTGNKSTGWKGTGSGTLHYNTSIFRKMLEKFKDSGEDVYFDMQVINDDASSGAGRQDITFINCNIDGGILSKFDADGEYLDEDVKFTFEDFIINKNFELLPGMR